MDRLFVSSSKTTLTYRDWLCDVSAVEKYLHIHFSDEKFIAIDSDNGINFITYYFAVIKSEKIAVLLNHKLPEKIKSQQLKTINCNIVIGKDKISCNIPANIITDFPHSHFESKKPSTVIFTSGSSGNYKAVLLNGSAFAESAKAQVNNLGITEKSRYLLNLPLYHVSGLSILYRCLIANAEILLSTENGNPFNDIVRFSPTHLSLVSTQLMRLTASLEMLPAKERTKIIKNISAILIGGSAIAATLKHQAKQLGLPVIYGYGSTETASAVCTTCTESNDTNSSGFPFGYCKIKISSESEILIKSGTLALGYLKDAVTVIPLTDTEGYFHTGDIGTFSPSNGLTIIGRKDNMFISGGENIYPEEIEKALCGLPEIESAVVSHIADKEFGNVPIAFIQCRQEISNEKIISALQHLLPNYKIPKIIKDIPAEYSRTGIKPDRQRLMELAGY